MENTILKFDKIESKLTHQNNYDVSDYFSKSITLFELNSVAVLRYPNLFKNYFVQDNDKFERISQELYGTPDHWDILTLLNGRDPMFGNPYETDVIETNIDLNANRYFKQYAQSQVNDDLRERFTNEISEEVNDINDITRSILTIKPQFLSDYIALCKEYKFI